MPTVKTELDDATYAYLVTKRKAAGLPSVSALFLSKCGVLDDGKEAAEIVRLALKRSKSKDAGFEFRVRDLFPKAQWEKFSKGARLRAGRLFCSEISAAVHGIRAARKSPSNQQIYVVAQ